MHGCAAGAESGTFAQDPVVHDLLVPLSVQLDEPNLPAHELFSRSKQARSCIQVHVTGGGCFVEFGAFGAGTAMSGAWQVFTASVACRLTRRG